MQMPTIHFMENETTMTPICGICGGPNSYGTSNPKVIARQVSPCIKCKRILEKQKDAAKK